MEFEKEAFLRKSCFRAAPPVRVVLMSYGGDFGAPPKHAIGFASVKNLPNPPASLRKHNGLNSDLRRFVVESHGAGEKIESIASSFRDLVGDRIRRDRWELEERVLYSFWFLRKLIGAECARLVCDLLVCNVEFEDLLLCIGCVAGQHRSVSVVEHLKETKALRLHGLVWQQQFGTFHRELENQTKKNNALKNKRANKRR